MKVGQRPDGRWIIIHDDHTVISIHDTKADAVAEFTRLRAKPPSTGCKHAEGIETMRLRTDVSAPVVDVAAGTPGYIRLVGSGWEAVDGGFRNIAAAVIITYGRWCKKCKEEIKR